MIFKHFNSISAPFKIFLLAFMVIAAVFDYFQYREREKYNENSSFILSLKYIDNASAKNLIEYKNAFDSLYLSEKEESIQILNSKYQNLFEKLSLSGNYKYDNRYLLIEVKSKVDTNVAIMITDLKEKEIYTYTRQFIHDWTLYSDSDSVFIYSVTDILN